MNIKKHFKEQRFRYEQPLLAYNNDVTPNKTHFMWTEGISKKKKKKLKSMVYMLASTINIHMVCEFPKNKFYANQRNIEKTF